MPGHEELIARSGDLKRALVDYAQGPRFAQTYRQALRQRFGWLPPRGDNDELVNFIDGFVLQERLPDGLTVVDHFVAEQPALTAEERTLLLGWRDVVEGIFEVTRRDGAALLAVNLIDDLTYRVRSNIGPGFFRQMPRGFFFGARMLPIGDEWLLSGAMTLFPAESREVVYQLVSDFAIQHPELVYRNPEKLARAWEFQRAERRHFIDFFGADLVVLPGREAADRLRAFTNYRMYEARDDEGRTAAEPFRETDDAAPPRLDSDLPADVHRSETVALINDEVEGLSVIPDFGRLAETFANPALAAERRHRRTVLDFLEDPDSSPLPLRRVAEQDRERASQVFQHILGQPDFSWERDGEALLRRYKPAFFDKPSLPSVAPLSDSLTRPRLDAPEPGHPPPQPNYRPARRGKKRRR